MEAKRSAEMVRGRDELSLSRGSGERGCAGKVGGATRLKLARRPTAGAAHRHPAPPPASPSPSLPLTLTFTLGLGLALTLVLAPTSQPMPLLSFSSTATPALTCTFSLTFTAHLTLIFTHTRSFEAPPAARRRRLRPPPAPVLPRGGSCRADAAGTSHFLLAPFERCSRRARRRALRRLWHAVRSAAARWRAVAAA